MPITDLLAQVGGLQAMARELGISEADTARGAAALAPAILGGLRKQADAQPAGAEGLGGLLAKLGGGGLLENVLSLQPTDVGRGNEVLGQLFGSKDVSQTVARSAAAQSGLDTGVLKQMLPRLAMLVTGYMAQQGGQGDAFGQGQQGSVAAAAAHPGLGDLLSGLLGGASGQAAPAGRTGGLASMLDMDGDGNPLDDILRMAGRLR